MRGADRNWAGSDAAARAEFIRSIGMDGAEFISFVVIGRYWRAPPSVLLDAPASQF